MRYFSYKICCLIEPFLSSYILSKILVRLKAVVFDLILFFRVNYSIATFSRETSFGKEKKADLEKDSTSYIVSFSVSTTDPEVMHSHVAIKSGEKNSVKSLPRSRSSLYNTTSAKTAPVSRNSSHKTSTTCKGIPHATRYLYFHSIGGRNLYLIGVHSAPEDNQEASLNNLAR